MTISHQTLSSSVVRFEHKRAAEFQSTLHGVNRVRSGQHKNVIQTSVAINGRFEGSQLTKQLCKANGLLDLQRRLDVQNINRTHQRTWKPSRTMSSPWQFASLFSFLVVTSTLARRNVLGQTLSSTDGYYQTTRNTSTIAPTTTKASQGHEHSAHSLLVNRKKHCLLTERPTDGGGAMVAALLQLHETYIAERDRCSGFLGWDAIEQTEAFLFARSKVSDSIEAWAKTAGFPTPVSKFLGSDIRDTCTSSLLGTAQAQDLVTSSAVYRSMSQTWLKSRLDSKAFEVVQKGIAFEPGQSSQSTSCKGPPQLLAIVGPTSSAEVAAISPLLSIFQIPHISFWATSTIFNNVGKYPYLFRTVPSDEHQVKAIADMLEHFGWKYIALIGDEDELYSGRGLEMIHLESVKRRTFCVGIQKRISQRDKDGIRSTARLLRQDKDAVVVVVFTLLRSAKILFDAMDEENVTHKVIIGSDDWVNRINPQSLATRPSLRYSAIFGLAPKVRQSPITRGWIDELQPLRLLTPKRLSRNPWLKPYLEDLLGCLLPPVKTCSIYAKSQGGSGEYECHYDQQGYAEEGEKPPLILPNFARADPLIFAMELVANAIMGAFSVNNTTHPPGNSSGNSTVCAYPSGGSIRSTLKSLKVKCPTKNKLCPAFNKHQGAYPAYHILNKQFTANNEYRMATVGYWDGQAPKRLNWNPEANLSFGPWGQCQGQDCFAVQPQSTCSTPCPPGKRRFFYDALLAQCCWTCQPCLKNSVSNATNSDQCIACQQGYQPSTDRRVCKKIVPETLETTDSWVVVIIVSSSLGALLTIATLAFFLWFRKTSLVRSMDLQLTVIILMAMLINHAITPFAIGVGQLTDHVCRANMIMSSPWRIAIMATILVKTNRFLLIFRASTLLRDSRLLFLMGTPMQILFAVVITICLWLPKVFYALLAPVRAITIYPTSTTAQLLCSRNVVWGGVTDTIYIVLIILTVLLAFRTRKLPENYNEAKQVYFASSTTLVVWIGLTPATYITATHLQPAITGLASACQMWAIWSCLYVPRIIMLLRNKRLRTTARTATFKSRQDMPSCIQRPRFVSSSGDCEFKDPETMTTMDFDNLAEHRELIDQSTQT